MRQGLWCLCCVHAAWCCDGLPMTVFDTSPSVRSVSRIRQCQTLLLTSHPLLQDRAAEGRDASAGGLTPGAYGGATAGTDEVCCLGQLVALLCPARAVPPECTCRFSRLHEQAVHGAVAISKHVWHTGRSSSQGGLHLAWRLNGKVESTLHLRDGR